MSYEASALGKDNSLERERLRTLERTCDPATFEVMASFDPRPGWRCLDAGAGGGSVARWMAATIPRAEVVATDLDVRYLNDLGSGVTVAEHDLTSDSPPPGGPFDLIHCRLVLEHIPGRELVLAKLAAWLAPGGWLVISGVDIAAGLNSPHAPLRTTVAAMTALIAAQVGTDTTFMRRVPALLGQAGLTQVGLRGTPLIVGDGSLTDAFFRSMLHQVTPPLIAQGLTSESDLSALTRWFDEPGNLDVIGLHLLTWAQRPA